MSIKQDTIRILMAYPAARISLIRTREAKGLHPRRVAERLSVSYPYYRGIELGKVMPEEDVIRRSAELLGMDAADMMRGGA